jgi:hypothetical protein
MLNIQIKTKRQLSRILVFALVFCPCLLFAQQKHALLIGISDYPQYNDSDASWSRIHGANDVQLLSPILSKQGFKVTTLTNKLATHDAITKSLIKLGQSIHPGDIVYIHLSGHGQAVEDENGDEVDGWDEAFIPYDAQHRYKKDVYQGENHLLDDELNVYLNSIRKKVGENGIVYVVIDACHAGSSYRGEEDEDSVYVRGTDIGFSKNRKPYTPPKDKRGNIRILSGKGMSHIYMLEACRSYEVNTEIKQNGQYYGPLSYYISQQLLTSPLSFDTKWIENVRRNMDKDTRLVRQNMVTESSK